MLLHCGVAEDSWESFGQQGDQTSQSQRKSTLSIHWKDWCWCWTSNTLVTQWEELTHWKRPWRWERLRARRVQPRMRWLDGTIVVNGHEFEPALRHSEEQGSLVCYSPWSHKASDMSWWWNNNKLLNIYQYCHQHRGHCSPRIWRLTSVNIAINANI